MKHDWIKIKDEYISAKSEALRTSLDSLATKYGVSQQFSLSKICINFTHTIENRRNRKS